jgi:hypothetical protein
MDILNLVIQLLSGAAGGNIAGNLSRNIDLGPIGNTLTGAVGGSVDGYLLSGLLGLAAVRAGGLEIGTFISAVLTGGVSGGILTAILGLIRARLARISHPGFGIGRGESAKVVVRPSTSADHGDPADGNRL